MNTNAMHDRRAALAVITLITALTALACGSVHHAAQFDPSFSPPARSQIEVGQISNDTGKTFDIDIRQMLTNALAQALDEKGLLASGDTGAERFILDARIIEYARGDALKRWLLPGWGTTVLSIQSELRRASSDPLGLPAVSAGGKTATTTRVASVEARRTVSIGGSYSIGAWRTIMNEVAEDVVGELERELR